MLFFKEQAGFYKGTGEGTQKAHGSPLTRPPHTHPSAEVNDLYETEKDVAGGRAIL